MRVSLCVPGSSRRCSSNLWRMPTVLVASFITKLWLPTIPVTVDFILIIFLSFRQQSLVNWTISCIISPRNFKHFLLLFIFVIDLCMDQGKLFIKKGWSCYHSFLQKAVSNILRSSGQPQTFQLKSPFCHIIEVPFSGLQTSAQLEAIIIWYVSWVEHNYTCH